MHNNPARGFAIFLEQGAQSITFFVGKMFCAKQGIAESQARRDAVFLHECDNVFRIRIAKSDAATTPQAIAGRTLDGADFTPLGKIFPVLAEKRQESLIQVVKFKQAGKVVENAHRGKYTYLYFARLPYFNYIAINFKI